MEIVGVFHNIRSLHNVGSLFRTSDAAGVRKVYLTGITPTPLDRFGKVRPQIHKVALGAERSVAWEKCAIFPLLRKLGKESYTIVAVEQDKKAIPYYFLFRVLSPKSRNKLALIVGNEVSGLPKTILRASDTIVEIPMKGKKESLNVAVAFGIIAFKFIEP